ncbi:MAG: hypothetical protein AUK24_08675 [Syntrophaceae bacterium CG2_30_49_12]|nr:MAG: hypothetical protein AUK24_08675 [Syntrophaceae bacterium CG2_30_49_12]PJC73815.1 MAG: hypothetical protein CO012_08115 [Syntrophobacterales bacterium CG_4_8_14_3_um_filter_49_14]
MAIEKGSGIRGQESEVRGQESEVRGRRSGVSRLLTADPCQQVLCIKSLPLNMVPEGFFILAMIRTR